MKFEHSELVYKGMSEFKCKDHQLVVIPFASNIPALMNFVEKFSLEENSRIYDFEYLRDGNVNIQNVLDNIEELVFYIKVNEIKDCSILSIEKILLSNKMWSDCRKCFEFKLSKIHNLKTTFYEF